MKITIAETRNGWLIVDGDMKGFLAEYLPPKVWSYNSLDAAIAQVRRILKSWKAEQAKEQSSNDE